MWEKIRSELMHAYIVINLYTYWFDEFLAHCIWNEYLCPKNILACLLWSFPTWLTTPNRPEGYICICLRGKCAKIIEAVPGKSREPAEKTNQLSYRSNIMQIAVGSQWNPINLSLIFVYKLAIFIYRAVRSIS